MNWGRRNGHQARVYGAASGSPGGRRAGKAAKSIYLEPVGGRDSIYPKNRDGSSTRSSRRPGPCGRRGMGCGRVSDPQVQVSLPGVDIAADRERATALFRILQETLTNVARHANATQVDVRLTQENGNLILEVRDNGKGIREEELSGGKSLGVLGMRERASLLGGEITISGIPGKGSTVSVRIPAQDVHPEQSH